MTLPFGAGISRFALAALGQAAFERALGGRDHALLLALDLLTECCDHVDVFQQDYRSPAERRWGEAAIAAHDAVLQAVGKDLIEERAFRNEYLEHAFLKLTPLAVAPYERKGAWIEAHLARLHELRFEATELMTPEYGEVAYEQEAQLHPIWCADQLFVQVQASNEWPRRAHPVGQHAWFAQLRAELQTAIAAAKSGDDANGPTTAPSALARELGIVGA
ncbi:hypothetical protein [Pelomonas sp. KK5]|uniref:hypothetical protein n=1 Tax=Pelomonas sp. KK5 TaxID=1855730 RepID=UPI00097C7BFE|nr:hypothetical protein [Pelomonas sp. KK5]